MKKVLFILLLLPCFAVLANQYKCYIALNINSCSYCNKATGLFMNNTFLSNAPFLMSDDDITQEQAVSYLNEVVGKPCKVIIDSALYNKVSQGINLFKMPHFVIMDSSEKVVFKVPIDSVYFYNDVIAAYTADTYKRITFSSSRLAKLVGQKSINKVKDYIFAGTWQDRERLFVYNIKNNSLDSIYLYNNNRIIQQMLAMNGSGKLNAAQVKEAYKKTNIMNSFITVSTSVAADDERVYGTISMMYPPDPKHVKGDGTEVSWAPFVFAYEPVSKKLDLSLLKYWESDSTPGNSFVVKDYRLDFAIHKRINDSTWLVSGEKDENHIDQNDEKVEKPFFYFRKKKGESRLSYTGEHIVYRYDSLISFTGLPLNRLNYFYEYKLEYPYLVYMQSPIILNYETNHAFNFMNITDKPGWIYDFVLTGNTMKILVNERKFFVLYTIDRKTEKLISRRELGPMDAKSNAILDGNDVYYMTKGGEVIQLKAEHSN